MNPEQAYEWHTDVVRALKDETSPVRARFEASIERGAHPQWPGKHAIQDYHRHRALIAQGQETLDVRLVEGWEPRDAEDEGDDGLAVGVIDINEAAADDAADAILLPFAVQREWSIGALARSATFYVTPDMCTLIEHAANSLDETDVMPYDPRYPNGFVVLATPLRLPYAGGGVQVVRAFGWVTYDSVRTVFGTSGHAGSVYHFADRVRDIDDKSLPAIREQFPSKTAWNNAPRLVPTIIDDFITGTLVGETTETFTADTRKQWADRVLDDSGSRATEPAADAVAGRFQPYLAAFLLLLTQQVTAPVIYDATPGARKRGQRVGRKASGVTVVDLRHRTHNDSGEPGDPGHGNRYHARHLVGGHWKWQPYGPNRSLRRRIFVEGYVRGPEDKPLVVKPKVYRL